MMYASAKAAVFVSAALLNFSMKLIKYACDL